MVNRNGVEKTLRALLMAGVLAIVVGQALGQPVLLSYVSTGSMEPTIKTGDGFVVIPAAITDDVEVGDVVVFRAQRLHGGGLTTHRIVDETERGYVTRGDANPYTDQDSVEPPVQDAQIVAQAWQVGGSVVVVPHLGTVSMAIREAILGGQRRLARMLGIHPLLGNRGLVLLLLGLSGFAYVADYLRSGSDTERDRARSKTRDRGASTMPILYACALLFVTAATVVMVVPAGTHQVDIISAEFESEKPTVIPAGESNSLEFAVSNGGLVPVHAYFEAPGSEIEVEPSHVTIPPQSTASVNVTIHAPEETGYARSSFHEHRYIAVLPDPVTSELYETHPWVPLAVVNALLGIGIVALGSVVLESSRVRTRTRERPSDGLGPTNLLKRLYR